MVAKGKVLVVDDEPDTVRLMRALLEKEGYQVFDASKGEDGLIKAVRGKPDIVLVDIRLPGMDGNKLLKRIKENNPEQTVIMVTAYADIDNAVTSLKFGADDFIRKPFDNAYFLHIVNKSMEGIRLRQEKAELKKRYEKLTKRKRLSRKEAVVLYGATRYSGASDRDVSRKLRIPRTTFTGVRNKLRKMGAYQLMNVPDYAALGFEMMSVIAYEMNPATAGRGPGENAALKKNGVIYSQMTDLEGLLVCVFPDYTEYKRELESHLNQLTYGGFVKRVFVHHFPLRLVRVLKFMDFSGFAGRFAEVKTEDPEAADFLNSLRQKSLSATEWDVVKALAEYSESSDAEVAKKVSLSRARVSQIKKHLQDDGVIRQLTFPSFSSVGAGIVSYMSAALSPKCSQSERKRLSDGIRRESSVVFSVIGDTEFVVLSVFGDYDHYQEAYGRIDRLMAANGCSSRDVQTIIIPTENIKHSKIDFHSALKNKK